MLFLTIIHQINIDIMKRLFSCNGGIISSDELDLNTYLSALRAGSEPIWGRYHLGYTYISKIKNGKPFFIGLKDKDIKLLFADEVLVEEGRMYKFLILKIVVDEVRKLKKIKVRNLGLFEGEILNLPENEND